MSDGTLGYWYIRGIAEPIRYLLHYADAEFEDKRYWSAEDWQTDKQTLDVPFPNLPYFIDGDVKLTQSIAILRYLAQKYRLDGKTKEERLQAMVVEQQLMDLRGGIFEIAYSAGSDLVRPGYIKRVPLLVKKISDFLGDRAFLVGDSVTYVDFLAYEVIDFHRLLIPSLLKDMPNLIRFQERVISLPRVKEYVNSSNYFKWPVFAPFAKFGGSGELPEYD